MLPRVLVLYARGTNRETELAYAFEKAGATVDIQPLVLLKERTVKWDDYQIIAIPGGFSYADILGAGRLFAFDLQLYFKEALNDFVKQGKPVIGICNGFQTLVSLGLLPGQVSATLTFNEKGLFECRWVTLKPVSTHCIWTRDLEPILCPVAHGEGRFMLAHESDLNILKQKNQIALTYCDEQFNEAKGVYPLNPNGSIADIAGVCNTQGNVLGLMPHPENYIFPFQHPYWTSQPVANRLALSLFQAGVKYAKKFV